MDELLEAADRIWWTLGPADWREAFRAHPKIGERRHDTGAPDPVGAAKWSAEEQSRVGTASESVLARLAQANAEHERRFGYIFIICATGLSADQILASLNVRLANDAADELRIAASEQAKITTLRLKKLLLAGDGSQEPGAGSQDQRDDPGCPEARSPTSEA